MFDAIQVSRTRPEAGRRVSYLIPSMIRTARAVLLKKTIGRRHGFRLLSTVEQLGPAMTSVSRAQQRRRASRRSLERLLRGTCAAETPVAMRLLPPSRLLVGGCQRRRVIPPEIAGLAPVLSVCPKTFRRENRDFELAAMSGSGGRVLGMNSMRAQKLNDFNGRFPDRH